MTPSAGAAISVGEAHAERRATLGRLLAASSRIWSESPFCVARPRWCDEHRDLRDALLALDDATLAELDADPARAAAWLSRWLPEVGALQAATALPGAPEAAAPMLNACYHIPGRKAAQVDAFVTAAGAPVAPLVEWCAGKGHLGRRFLMAWGGEALAVERDAALCRDGEALSARAGLRQRFLPADVLAPATLDTLRGAHAVALHACGALHRRLIAGAAAVGAPAIDVAPCCYGLGDDADEVAGGEDGPRLGRDALKLAVTETVTASPRLAAQSARASAWKLAFVATREALCPHQPYRPFRPTPGAWFHEGFAAFLSHLAAREGLELPAGFDFAAAEAAGWRRHHQSRRLQLPRLAFRRAIEVWLLCDLAVALERRAYRVRLVEFCPRALSPRNVLLSARR